MDWLKNGDKIRMTRGFGTLSAGDIVTIEAVDKYDEHMPYLVTGGYWLESGIFEPAEAKKAKFEVGQVYRSNRDDAEKGNIVKITEASGKWIKYNTIRGIKRGTGFMKGSLFAEGLVLLTGKEIGEAIRKWDTEHAKKPEPEYNEVKRHAKPGECIKLTEAPYSFSHVGDILKMGVDGEHILGKDHPYDTDYDGWEWPYVPDEYVVLEGYKPQGKHSYTAKQIAEAKRIVLETLKDIYQNCKGSIVFGADKTNHNIIRAYFFSKDETKMRSEEGERVALEARNVGYASVKCSDHDEPNEWIGKCVALCKALHKPIPVFITGD